MATPIPKKIALIIASTRAVRVGPTVVSFVHQVLLTSPSTPKPEISIIDIASFNLPVFNERVVPALIPKHGQFQYEHSKAWSATIKQFDGYIIVAAEYNHGVPGGLKNAIDYLYHEWTGKPVLIITYGVHGGNFSSEALKETLGVVMKLRVVETRPMLKFAGPGMEEVMMAGVGRVGPKTMEEWEDIAKGPFLKGFEELVELLEAAAEEPTKPA
jgi:NAD(P)H-dependent FMN reductase